MPSLNSDQLISFKKKHPNMRGAILTERKIIAIYPYLSATKGFVCFQHKIIYSTCQPIARFLYFSLKQQSFFLETAHEDRCSAVGNLSMSMSISARMEAAPFPIPSKSGSSSMTSPVPDYSDISLNSLTPAYLVRVQSYH
ncbi:MAG: hypothetical protein HS132_06940 [Planctomycetia bacterium]|nr:hypothetical protein [Planctomycetia bacterium]